VHNNNLLATRREFYKSRIPSFSHTNLHLYIVVFVKCIRILSVPPDSFTVPLLEEVPRPDSKVRHLLLLKLLVQHCYFVLLMLGAFGVLAGFWAFLILHLHIVFQCVHEVLELPACFLLLCLGINVFSKVGNVLQCVLLDEIIDGLLEILQKGVLVPLDLLFVRIVVVIVLVDNQLLLLDALILEYVGEIVLVNQEKLLSLFMVWKAL
jgi:hypothetical protein